MDQNLKEEAAQAVNEASVNPLVPIGTIMHYAGIPDLAALQKQGWMPCEG